MLIPTAILTEHAKPVGVWCFDTVMNKFVEEGYSVSDFHYLDTLDGLTFEKSGINTAALLGYYRDNYVITIDYTSIFYVSKQELLKYTPINYIISKNGTIRLKQGRLQNLEHIFRDDTFTISSMLFESCSSGVQRKVKGYDNKTRKVGIIKYPLANGSKDIEYEVLYSIIGEAVGIPVCPAKLGVCCGKPCVLSVFKYKEAQSFMSIHKYMVSRSCWSLDEMLIRLNDVETFIGYMLLDYVCEQEDRHSKNIAVCNEKLYPLYDNGKAFRIGTIGRDSQRYRLTVERNIKQWHNTYEYVRAWLMRFEDIILPLQYQKEQQIIRENVVELRGRL